jgi:hypothetical protein
MRVTFDLPEEMITQLHLLSKSEYDRHPNVSGDTTAAEYSSVSDSL